MGLEPFITDTLGLKKLPPYLPTFVYAFLGFTFVHLVLAPWVSRRWFPVAYTSKGRLARNTWAIHIVSQVHTIIIVPASLWVLWNEGPEQKTDKVFGWDSNVGYLYAIACGYFLWDALDAIINFIDTGFVIHGFSCLIIYAMSYRPFVAYYGARCLLWETSTFFLNINWFMDKTGRTGSTAQLVNGFFLLSSFLGVRLIYGGRLSVELLFMLSKMYHDIPWFYTAVYALGNVMLTSLNWFWFYKMITALRRRFRDIESKSQGQPLLNNGSSSRDRSISEEPRVINVTSHSLL